MNCEDISHEVWFKLFATNNQISAQVENELLKSNVFY